MNITIADVAKHANVSKGTVSNYLTKNRNVSEKKSKQIQASINELGFTANEVARSLRTNTFNTVGVLISSFNNIYLVRIVGYIEKLLNERNYSMLPMSFDGDYKKMQELMTHLLSRTDGVICVPTQNEKASNEFYKECIKLKPIVTISETIEGITVDSIVTNSEQTTYEVIKNCLEKGHREIAFIVGSHELSGANRRMVGALRAFEEFGLEINYSLVKNSPKWEDSGKRLCAELLDENPNISAIYVANYRNTIGVLGELKERKLSDKISVIGFDAGEIENLIEPKLTYISHPKKDISQSAVSLLFKRIEKGDNDYPEKICVDGCVKNIDSILSL